MPKCLFALTDATPDEAPPLARRNELFSEITIRIKFQTFSLAKLDRDFFAASRARTMARRTFTSSSPTPSLTNHSTDWRISKPAPRRFLTIVKLLRPALGLLLSRFRGAASQWCASRSSCGVPARTRLCNGQPDLRPACWARAQAHPNELCCHQGL